MKLRDLTDPNTIPGNIVLVALFVGACLAFYLSLDPL